jgi:mono/diheme cytochrome c family protein
MSGRHTTETETSANDGLTARNRGASAIVTSTMDRRPRWARGLLAGLAAVAALGAWAGWELTRTAPARSTSLPSELPGDPVKRGEIQFAHGDLGVLDLDTLETSALPWVALTAALALDVAQGDAAKVSPALVEQAFRKVGFLYPEGPVGAEPRPPLGLTLGSVERMMPPLRVTAANLGCAACHAGTTYGADGAPRPGLPMPGMPNTSLDLEAYAWKVYRALKRGFADEAALWRAIDILHPRLTWRERLSLAWLVLPRARARMAELARDGDQPLPFANGAPGLTNGVAALKFRLGETEGYRLGGAGFVSIPDLADRSFRSALLADGAYAPAGRARFGPRTAEEASRADPAELAGIGSFFTVPSMGMAPERAEAAIPAFTDIARFLATYRPQPFPGPVDRAKLPLGRAVYARACAACHGAYDGALDRPRLVSFPNWAGDVGTDMSRARAFDSRLAARVNGTVYARHMAAEATGKLAAPLLSGVWATAPYFTNGSVPTLRHLLEPATRPDRFLVGGHRLDFARVGLALASDATGLWRDPSGYRPFSRPAEIDTSKPGFSNRGHEREVEDLSAEERDALIEYLKLL